MTIHKTILNYFRKKVYIQLWVVGIFIPLGDTTSSQRDFFRGKRSANFIFFKIFFSSSNILTL